MSALPTLLQHAEGERDQALAAVRRADEQCLHLQAQAEQLTTYRADYQRRWSGEFSRRGQIEIVHCYQSFMQRLDEAVTQQRQQLDAAQAQQLQLRARLLACETRVASVRKLIERRRHDLQQLQDRREQRQTDETAQQILWRAAQEATAPTDR